MCQNSTHLQTKLSLMTGTSNISRSIATLTTSIFYSMLIPAEAVKSSPKPLEIKVAGEKGRGLFATSNIRRNSFIYEYKVPRSRPPFPCNQRPAVEQEYKENGEGCYEAQDSEGQWWCFDPTRRVNQFGRYTNHTPWQHGKCRSRAPCSCGRKTSSCIYSNKTYPGWG